MKNIITFIIILLSAFVSSGQTYLNGNRVASLATVADSKKILNNQRLPISEAFEKLKIISPHWGLVIIQTPDEMQGEFWLVNGMLIQIITRTVTPEYPQEDFKSEIRAVAPDIHINDPDDRLLNTSKRRQWFSEIKKYNDFEALVYYYKKEQGYKSFRIQDKAGRYGILGKVYVKEDDAPKAHLLINEILDNITFK